MRYLIALLVLLHLDVTQASAADLRVIFLERELGRIPGVTVFLDEVSSSHVSNEKGEVVFQGVAVGVHKIRPFLAGALEETVTVCFRENSAPVMLLLSFTGGSCCVVWAGEPPLTGTWQGKVVDPGMRSLAAVIVEAQWEDGSGITSTNAAGEFEFIVPIESRAVSYRVVESGYQPRTMQATCWDKVTLQLWDAVCEPASVD